MFRMATHSISAIILALFLLCVQNEAVAQGRPSGDQHVLTIRVATEDGGIVEGAEAWLINEAEGYSVTMRWKHALDGRILFVKKGSIDPTFRSGSPPREVRAVVRAPGYAWSMETIRTGQDAVHLVTLSRGQTIDLILKDPDGREFPEDLEPILFVEGQSVNAWLAGIDAPQSDDRDVFSTTVTENLGGGRYRFSVPDNCNGLYVLINHPGFLRGFQAGPFDTSQIEAGTIEIELPRPGTLSVSVKPASETLPPDYTGCGVAISYRPDIPAGNISFGYPPVYSENQTQHVTHDDLAPGYWVVEAITGTAQTRHNWQRADYATANAYELIESGEKKSITLLLETYNEDVVRDRLGTDHEATIQIMGSDGKPAAGRNYKVTHRVNQFSRTIEYASGIVPEDGVIKLTALPDYNEHRLEFYIDKKRVGSLSQGPGIKQTTFEFYIPLTVGEMAPDITLHPLDGGEPMTLSSLRGKVVFLDFWASWCSPCQPSMSHNNEMMERLTKEWSGKAVIIGASIDEELATIQAHVAKRQWNHVMQTWCGQGAWKSVPAMLYDIGGIPSAFLIDQHGKLVWAGHPGGADIEEMIGTLLKESP